MAHMSLYQSEIYINDLEVALESSIHKESLIDKKVLITGATGTIGSFLVDMLLRYSEEHHAEITVYAAARSLGSLKNRFRSINSKYLVFVEHDITKPIDFSFSVDYIIHAAGNAHPAAFNSDPVGTIIGNVNGTYNLLEYARKCGAIRFLYVSSGEVYGQGDLSLKEYEEAYMGYVDPISPRSCYPNSKRVTETLCTSYFKQYGLKSVIVRPCHTYGPGITATDNRANVQFMNNVLNGEDIVLKSSGTQLRSYCYVADCASAILTALVDGTPGEAYNIANPCARVTIAGFAQIVADAGGKKVVFENPTIKELADQSPIAKQVLSSRKLEDLGWRGHYTVAQGVSNTLAILQGR